MKSFDVIFLITLLLCGFTFVYKQPQTYDLVLSVVLFCIAIININNINIRHICGLLITYKLAIYCLMNFYLIDSIAILQLDSIWTNSILFGIQLITLTIMTGIMFYRPVLSRFIENKRSPVENDQVTVTFADNILVLLFKVLTIITLIVFCENIIRHLDYVGFSEEFAKNFWHWIFFYNHFEILTHVVEILCCLFIFYQALIDPRVLKKKALA